MTPELSGVKRRRRRETPLHDDALAIPVPAVARRAEDVEPVAPAVEDTARQRATHDVGLAALEHPGVQELVVVQVAARDGAGHGRARRRALERLLARARGPYPAGGPVSGAP